MVNFEFNLDDPLHPTTVTDTLTRIYNAKSGADICPAEPDPATLDSYFAKDYSWPEGVQSHTELADLHNLTVTDAESILNADYELNLSTSPAEVEFTLNTFMEKEFNIPVTFDGFENHPDAMPPLEDLIYNSQTFVHTMGLLPKEHVEGINLTGFEFRPLVLETEQDEAFEHPAAGLYIHNLDGSTQVQIDIDHIGDRGVLFHEIVGHGTHFTTCDGLYVKDPDALMRDDAITSRTLPNEIYIGKIPDDEEYNDQVFVSAYSRKNPTEDVAEITEALILATSS